MGAIVHPLLPVPRPGTGTVVQGPTIVQRFLTIYILLPFYKQSKSYLALLQVIFLGGRFYRSVRLRINCRIWIRSICLYRKYRNKSKKDDKNHKNVKIVEDLVLCKVFNYNGLTLKFVQWF